MKSNNKRVFIRGTILLILLICAVTTLYLSIVNKKETQILKVQNEAPNFVLENLNGESVKLNDLKGKPLMLNFWGSWCGPCKKEMPTIESAYNKYKDEGFEVITINIEEPKFTAKRFLKNNNVKLPVLLDATGEVYNAYGVYNLPASFFLNRDGTINKVHEGEINKNDLEISIQKILNKD